MSKKTKQQLEGENKFLVSILVLCCVCFVLFILDDVLLGEGVENNPIEKWKYERDMKKINEENKDYIKIEVKSILNQIICWNQRDGTRKMETPNEIYIFDGNICVYEEYFETEEFLKNKEGITTYNGKEFNGMEYVYEQLVLKQDTFYKFIDYNNDEIPNYGGGGVSRGKIKLHQGNEFIPEETPIYCDDYDNFDDFIMGGIVFTDDSACEPIREDYASWMRNLTFMSCISGCGAYQFSRFDWFEQDLIRWGRDKNAYMGMEKIKIFRSDMSYFYSWNFCAESCIDMLDLTDEERFNLDTSIVKENNVGLRDVFEEFRGFTIEDIHFEDELAKEER